MRNLTVYLRAELARRPSDNEQRWVARATRGRASLRWDDRVLIVGAAVHVAEQVHEWLTEILRSLRLADDIELCTPERSAAP